jgi:hypothetical protein
MGRGKTILQVKEVEPAYLTVSGLTKYLGGVCSRDVQQRLRETKQIPFYVVANKILYRKSDIDKFVERHRITLRNSTKLEQD